MIFSRKTVQSNQLHDESRLIQLFSALSDRRRFEIMQLLLKRDDLSVSQIADIFRITASAASQQLKYLELAGLIRKNRMGQKVCYEIKNEDSLVRELLKFL